VSLARRLAASGTLERIVVDEFHYVLLPDVQYRPHLLNLRSITQYGTRITLLSATVPFHEQRNALRLLGVPSDCKVYREPTLRTNIRYEVDYIQSKRVSTTEIVEYVQRELH
jgi:superfamily II DNA helicase RecQ